MSEDKIELTLEQRNALILSNAAYFKGNVSAYNNLELVGVGSGYILSYAFKDENNNLYISFKGTDDFNSSVIDFSYSLFAEMNSTIVAQIRNDVDKFLFDNKGNYNNVIFTGHSLGGMAAQMAASLYGEPCITFGSPGILKDNYVDENSENFQLTDDGIVNLSKHFEWSAHNYGRIVNVKGSSGEEYKTWGRHAALSFSFEDHLISAYDSRMTYNGHNIVLQKTDGYLLPNLPVAIKDRLRLASKQKDPIVISKDNTIRLNGIGQSDFSQLNDNGIQALSGSVDDINGTYFIVLKTDTGYKQLLPEDLKPFADATGNISASGNTNLFVWDGKTTYQTLSAFGIASLNINMLALGEDDNGNTIVAQNTTGVTYTDSSTGAIAQVALEVSSTYTTTDLDKAADTSTVSSLPDLHGYGVLSSLHASMTINPTLQAKTTALAQTDLNTVSYRSFEDSFQSLLDSWEGTATLSIGNYGVLKDDPTSKHQILQFLEKYTGEAYYFQGRLSYQTFGAPSAAFINEAYNDITSIGIAQFVLQMPQNRYNTLFSYDITTDIILPKTDFGQVLAQANSTFSNGSEISEQDINFNILADMILAASYGTRRNLGDIYQDMTQNADEASRLIMTAQNLYYHQDGDTLSVTQSQTGAHAYTWSGDINERILYGYGGGLYVETNPDVLSINANEKDVSVSIANGGIILGYQGKTLWVDENGFAKFNHIIFKDQEEIQWQDSLGNASGLSINDTSLLNASTNGSLLVGGTSIALQSLSTSYDFSADATLFIDQANVNINLLTQTPMKLSDIVANSGVYVISNGTHSLTINMKSDGGGIASVRQQSGNVFAVMGTSFINDTSAPNTWTNITTQVTQPGTYTFKRSNFHTFDISSHAGTDIIYLDGYTGRPFENIKYVPVSGSTVIQTKKDEISIYNGTQTILLKNAMWTPGVNGAATDINTINGTGFSSYAFDMENIGGVLSGGFNGLFSGVSTPDISDVIVTKGTTTNILNPDGHDIFMEIQDRSDGHLNTNTTSTFSMKLSYKFTLSAVYDAGNIQVIAKAAGQQDRTYTIVDAANTDWGKLYINVSAPNYSLSYSNTYAGSIALTYNQTDNEDMLVGSLNSQNIININGISGNFGVVSGKTDANDTYNVAGGGTYNITGYSSINTVNATSFKSLSIQMSYSSSSNNIILNRDFYDSATWTLNGNDLIGKGLGQTITLKDYSTTNYAIRPGQNAAAMMTNQSFSMSSAYSSQILAYTKTSYFYANKNSSGVIQDNSKGKLSFYDYGNGGTHDINLNGSMSLYLYGSDTIRIHTSADDSRVTIGNETASNISVSNETLSYDAQTSSGITHVSIDNVFTKDATGKMIMKILTSNKAFDAIKASNYTTGAANIAATSASTAMSRILLPTTSSSDISTASYNTNQEQPSSSYMASMMNDVSSSPYPVMMTDTKAPGQM